MRFRMLYTFQVFDEIKNGTPVFVTDRSKQKIAFCDDMTISELALLLGDAKVDENNGGNRFEFWTENDNDK